MLKEILAAVSMASGGFLFVMVAGNLLKGPLADMLGGRVSFATFLEFCLLLIPSMAPYVLPIGILTGVLLVLGRMSAQNEITAMKASGMSLWRIVAPIFAIGIAGTLLALFVNCEYTPKSDGRLKRLIKTAIHENPTDVIGEKVAVTDLPGFLIYADKREGDTLRDVWIWIAEKLPDGKYGRETELVRAERAEFSMDRGNPDNDADDLLRVRCFNAVVERREAPNADGKVDPVIVGGLQEFSREIPIGKLFDGTKSGEKKLRWHTLSELLELREKVGEFRLTELLKSQEKGAKPEAGTTDRERFADRIKVQLQIQTGIANAFGILSLTMLAIPLGIRVSRSETFVNFGVALALTLTYYLLMVFMSWIRNPYLRPDLLVWLPNIVIQVVALRLLNKAAKS
jgi:lipopolysaccharide export system permease protein